MRRALPLLCLLLLPPRSHAQIPVTDAGAAAQRVLEIAQAVLTATNTAAMYVRQGEQLVNEYNLIRNQILQLETMVRNLERIPEGLNLLDTITTWSQQLDALLGQAGGISFTLETATGQFDTLYRQMAALNANALYTQRTALLQSRLEASSTAVKMQSLRTNVSDLFTRLCALLSGSWVAKGNLDSQQIAAQQNALLIHSQQAAQAMLATSQRLEAQRQAEEVILTQQALQFYREGMTLAPIGDWRTGPQVDIEIPAERR
jgi:P-type conjugative transfer protein TrbJ